MNPIKLLISFSPWILFGILAGHSLTQLEIALVLSLILSVIVGFKDLKAMMIIPWVTFLFFLGAIILITGLKLYGFIPYLGIASNAALTLVTFGSLLVGVPFTIQYARKEVPRERWNDPEFFRINQVLTGFWGLLFLINLSKSVYDFYYPGALGFIGNALLWVNIIIGIVITKTYPAYARGRIHRT